MTLIQNDQRFHAKKYVTIGADGMVNKIAMDIKLQIRMQLRPILVKKTLQGKTHMISENRIGNHRTFRQGKQINQRECKL